MRLSETTLSLDMPEVVVVHGGVDVALAGEQIQALVHLPLDHLTPESVVELLPGDSERRLGALDAGEDPVHVGRGIVGVAILGRRGSLVSREPMKGLLISSLMSRKPLRVLLISNLLTMEPLMVLLVSGEPLKVLLMSGEPLKLRRERLSPEHWETLLSCCSGMITREPLTALLRHLARESLKALLGGGQIVPPVAEVVSSSPPGSLEGRHPPHPDWQQSNLHQVSVSLGSGQRLPELEDLQHVLVWADLQRA